MAKTKENETMYFETYKEAIAFAKANLDKVITRSIYGTGFICKDNTQHKIELRKAQNIARGRPANSHLPWRDSERSELDKLYKINVPLDELAKSFDRTESAIMGQLKKMHLISSEEHQRYLVEKKNPF